MLGVHNETGKLLQSSEEPQLITGRSQHFFACFGICHVFPASNTDLQRTVAALCDGLHG